MNIDNLNGTLTVTGSRAAYSDNLNGYTTTTTTTTTGTSFISPYNRKMEHTEIATEDGLLYFYITFLLEPVYGIHSSNSVPKRNFIKEKYGVLDGKLQLISSEKGTE